MILDERIELADYNPRWPEFFRGECGRLADALGETVTGIEHIGSTAVPGLTGQTCGGHAGGRSEPGP